VYENPLFIAALDSVTSQLLTTSQAAEKFGIRESALIAALSWCDGDGEDRCASVPTTSDSTVTVSTSNVQVLVSFLSFSFGFSFNRLLFFWQNLFAVFPE